MATPADAEPSAAEAAGGYVTYSDYSNDPGQYAGADVVLFFNADWCPTCRSPTPTSARRPSRPV